MCRKMSSREDVLEDEDDADDQENQNNINNDDDEDDQIHINNIISGNEIDDLLDELSTTNEEPSSSADYNNPHQHLHLHYQQKYAQD